MALEPELAAAAPAALVGLSGLFSVIFASSLMYYAENAAQPEVFSSIPASMWWGIVTLTIVKSESSCNFFGYLFKKMKLQLQV